MNLYLLNYNNYYNRQVKDQFVLTNYIPYLSKPCTVGDMNPMTYDFIPNDGVSTEAVINWEGQNPDYVIVADDNVIVSRWFVIESVRLRSGQYQISLYRDLVVDFYNEIIKAPMFVEKGYVGIEDPAIYNMEEGNFNQIKKTEYLLKDNTKSAWIVGYCAKGDGQAQGEEIKYGGIPQPNFSVADIEDWEYNSLVDTNTKYVVNNLLYTVKSDLYLLSENLNQHVKLTFNNKRAISITTEEDTVGLIGTGYRCDSMDLGKLQYYKATDTVEQTALNQVGYKTYSWGTPDDISALKNKVLQVGTGETAEYFRIKPEVSNKLEVKTIKSGTNLYTALSNMIAAGVDIKGTNRKIITGTPIEGSFEITYAEYTLKITLSPIDATEGFTNNLPGDRPVLTDAPYCMFCIPYGENYKVQANIGTFQVSQFNAMCLATGIATSLGGLDGTSKIYDLQLLPYCPIPLVREAGEKINLLSSSEIADKIHYTLMHESRTIIFWATESSGTFNITYNQYTSDNPVDFKINQQTKKYRLCSPNYNGLFDFTLERNRGTRYINVDYTYKPHQPYIHLNPNFGGLYGQDFNDARGLILGGDFSLPIIDDAWRDYQIANKNYQNMFNRQIENMEITNAVSREKELWQSISGAVSGAGTVGFAGALINPIIGIGAGLAGAGLSAMAGAKDRELNDILRNEALDYTKDNFAYQIDNIKALPQALTRISAFNANNKLFPFVEIYDATDTEKEALKNKIKYNGMTIGRIGTLEEFIPYRPNLPGWDYGYFKGQLIRLEGIDDDFHIAKAIATELNKGVYIP